MFIDIVIALAAIIFIWKVGQFIDIKLDDMRYKRRDQVKK